MKGRAPKADLKAMERAVRNFLAAAGLDAASPALRETPALVARAWRDEFLDGYRRDPSQILDPHIALNGHRPALVLLDHIDYVTVCPHHLLPSRGRARVAYAPGRWIVGLGQIAQLVEALAHRLVLQEDLGEQIVAALMRHLGARGAACRLEAEHTCLRLRGEKQTSAVTHTEALAGRFLRDPILRRTFSSPARKDRR